MDTQAYTITADHLEALPVFPLPGLVFFPFTALPLHIFEPRYRALIQHCLERDWPLVLTRIKPPHEHQADGRPPLETIATAGYIVQHIELPDGRYNILLGGMQRVRLLEEVHSDHSFRSFKAEIIEDVWPEDRNTLQLPMRTLRSCLSLLDQHRDRGADPHDVEGNLYAIDDPAILSNALAAAFVPDIEERQALLACPEVAQRLDRVIEQVAGVIAQLKSEAGMLN